MILRIRRSTGVSGDSNYYHHADIICENKQEALKACKERRVVNWRWIDTYDTCIKDYVEYIILYEVTESQSKNPMKPLEKKREN